MNDAIINDVTMENIQIFPTRNVDPTNLCAKFSVKSLRNKEVTEEQGTLCAFPLDCRRTQKPW